MKTIALYNIKGGVGKTATAVNLSFLASRDARPTLLFDLDPQGSASFYFRVKPKVKGKIRKFITKQRNLEASIKGTDYQDLDLIPADFAFRALDLKFNKQPKSKKQLQRMLSPLASQYDYVFLDCPPGISLVSENVFRVADIVLVPTVPTPLSIRTLDQITDFFDKKSLDPKRLVPFFSMVEKRKSIHNSILTEHLDDSRIFLRTQIPYLADVERMGVHREPVPAFAPGSPSARAYSGLWREIRTLIA